MKPVTQAEILNIATFNCHGLKSSLAYVKYLVSNHDVLFVCEHWLRPSEIHVLRENDLTNEWVYMKSSIDNDETLVGRPYGGCGFICKKQPGMAFRPIVVTESDRMCGLEVIINQKRSCVSLVYICHTRTIPVRVLRCTWKQLTDYRPLLMAVDLSPV